MWRISTKLLYLYQESHSHFTVLKCLRNEIFAYIFILKKLILKSVILCFVIFEFGLRTSTYKFFLQLQSWPMQVKMWDILHVVKISTVDIIRCVKLSSHDGICEEQAKEWEVFRYWRACFSKLQNTTNTEGTLLLIFPKDEVRRTHC